MLPTLASPAPSCASALGLGCGPAAGWELVQRDWGLRQLEPGAPTAIRRAAARVMRVAGGAVRAVAAWISRAGSGA
jgi:hypothetical protein